MLYNLRLRKDNTLLMVVNDATCIIATLEVEGMIKGTVKRTMAFIPGPGIPPLSIEDVYAEPSETWPDIVVNR